MAYLLSGGDVFVNKVRRDVVLVALKQGQLRLALTVLVMPRDYALEKRERRDELWSAHR